MVAAHATSPVVSQLAVVLVRFSLIASFLTLSDHQGLPLHHICDCSSDIA